LRKSEPFGTLTIRFPKHILLQDTPEDRAQTGGRRDTAVAATRLLTLLPDLVAALRESGPHDHVRRRLGEPSLTPRQMTALIGLHLRGPQSMSAFAAGMGIGRAAATELVERLEDLELVRRSHAAADRRVVVVTLSPDAEREARTILQRRRRDLERTLDRFPDVPPEIFAEFVSTLVERLREE